MAGLLKALKYEYATFQVGESPDTHKENDMSPTNTPTSVLDIEDVGRSFLLRLINREVNVVDVWFASSETVDRIAELLKPKQAQITRPEWSQEYVGKLIEWLALDSFAVDNYPGLSHPCFSAWLLRWLMGTDEMTDRDQMILYRRIIMNDTYKTIASFAGITSARVGQLVRSKLRRELKLQSSELVDFLNRPVIMLAPHFNYRELDYFRTAAIKRVGDLVLKTEADLLAIIGFGHERLETTKQVLEGAGLHLAPDG